MKNAAKKRIIAWSIVSSALALVLILGLVFVQANRFSIVSFGSDEDFSKYESGTAADFESADISAIDLSWESGSVNIEKSNSRSISISQNDDYDEMYWRLSEGKLKVYSSKGSSFNLFGFGAHHEKTLTLKLPADIGLEKLEINCVSAQLNADCPLSAEKVRVNTVSGKAEIKEAVCKDLKINTVSGNVSVEKGSFEKCKLDSVSGAYRLCAAKGAKDIDINTVSGDAVLVLPKGISGFSASLDSVSGELSSDFESKYSSDDKKTTYGDGSLKISIHTISGNASVKSLP